MGQLLFYDKILSGNQNISCSSCHHPTLGTGDGLSLGIGEGGRGLGRERVDGIGSDQILHRIPRNAPALWNLGSRDIRVLFHDGRLSRSMLYGNGFSSPAQEYLPDGLNSILAAQALFPLTAQFEMAGQPSENDVAGAAYDRIDYVWPILVERLRGIEEYNDLFVEHFEEIQRPIDISITHVVNALAAFMAIEWKSNDSPFDQFLAGDLTALNTPQMRGMALFYGDANCASCHAGSLLSDQKFYAIELPTFGPGRTRAFELTPRDVGFMAVTDRTEDAYRFRTPMLRNVAMTAPYGHNGAYPTLEGIIRHHLNPDRALENWTRDMAALPHLPAAARSDFLIQEDRREQQRYARARDITPVQMNDNDISDLIAFMHALTGSTIQIPPFGQPDMVPSGLRLD